MGKEYPVDEAAQWGQTIDGAVQKYIGDARNVLTEMASRGFMSPPGASLQFMVDAGRDAKVRLVEANSKVYQTEVDEILREEETDQKVEFGLAKLDSEAYQAALNNAQGIAEALADMEIKERRAAIEILQSEVDKRQAYIIEEQARVEHEVNYWKKLAIEAEKQVLDAEKELAWEQLKTAEARLEIISYLYQIIEAEQLVIEAEKKRSAALEELVEKEEQIVKIKIEMIPLYQERSNAQLERAEAIEKEAVAKKGLAELGYERIELKRAEEDANHQIREAERDYEEAHLKAARANATTELARAEAGNKLLEYSNKIKELIIKLKETLAKKEITFRLGDKQYWTKYKWLQEKTWAVLEKTIYSTELTEKLLTMLLAAQDEYDTILSGKERNIVRTTSTDLQQTIIKG